MDSLESIAPLLEKRSGNSRSKLGAPEQERRSGQAYEATNRPSGRASERLQQSAKALSSRAVSVGNAPGALSSELLGL